MDEQEHKIISELSKNSVASQRHLSKVSNLSLGMVNIILHRLIEKGYMKIRQLDGRKVQYILTPKGFAEKIERSKQYVKNTISIISGMKEAVKKIVIDYYNCGQKNFCIFGDGELAAIIELAMSELPKDDINISFYKTNSFQKLKFDTKIVFCVNKIPNFQKTDILFVDIMQKIAEIME